MPRQWAKLLLRAVDDVARQVCLKADRLFAQPSAHNRVEAAIRSGLQAHILVERTPGEGKDGRWFAVDDSIHGFTLEFETQPATLPARGQDAFGEVEGRLGR